MPLLPRRCSLRRNNVLVMLLIMVCSFLSMFYLLRSDHPSTDPVPLPATPLLTSPPHSRGDNAPKAQIQQPGKTNPGLPTPAPAPRQEEVGRARPKVLREPKDWPEFFVPRTQQQFSLEYPYLYQASRTCQTRVDVVVMTLSPPKNHLERQAIRQTWGSVVNNGTWPGVPAPHVLPKSVGVVFLLGEELHPDPSVSEAVRRESEKYGDVVQWKGLRDTYFNQTMKVLLGLKWVAEVCPNVSHVIKTNDDTFVHMQRLLHLLTKESSPLIWGPYFTMSSCERQGKYQVSREAYPFAIYPPHVKGNLYVLPGESVPRMVDLAAYLPYNNMEDTHVTGTLARALAFRHRPFTPKQFSTNPRAPHPCLFQDNLEALGSPAVSPRLASYFWSVISGVRPCH